MTLAMCIMRICYEQGLTHRLEIHPEMSGTTVYVSGYGSNEDMAKGAEEYQRKFKSLKQQMDHLKAEVSSYTLCSWSSR